MYEKYIYTYDNDSKSDKSNKYMFTQLSEQYLIETARLLNSEWPRKLEHRCESLKAFINRDPSRLKIPVSLILVDCDRVIGHASLVSISTLDDNDETKNSNDIGRLRNLTFLQSLIIDEFYRGRGLGRKFMELAEAYLIEYREQNSRDKSLDCDWLYLNTKDKQTFYERIGYVRIDPLRFFTNRESSKCTEIMKRLFSNNSTNQSNTSEKVESQQKTNREIHANSSPVVMSLSAPTPPPPPPPPPPPQLTANLTNQVGEELFWFKKRLFTL